MCSVVVVRLLFVFGVFLLSFMSFVCFVFYGFTCCVVCCEFMFGVFSSCLFGVANIGFGALTGQSWAPKKQTPSVHVHIAARRTPPKRSL